MPLTKVAFNPGVNKESTSYAAENGWFDSNLIRFRKGRAEKMGGWSKISSNSVQGTTRSLHVFSALDASKLMGVGTEEKFYIEEGGTFNDITPLRRTQTLGSNPITTGSSGSAVITFTDVNNGARTGDFVTISGATTTDGVTAAQINLEFEITVINSNTFTVTTTGSASSGSTAGGGSAVVAAYQISAGLGVVVPGTGWGAGLWGGYSSSFSETTLDGAINNSVTSLALTSASDFEAVSTTLSANITDVSTSIPLSNSSSFASKGTILVGSEKIEYGNNNSNVLSDLTRGADGTTAAAASSGASVTFVGIMLIDDELIQYTGKSTNTIDAGVVRGVRGTTAAAHDDDVAVKEANAFVGWGEAANITTSAGSNIRLWSQDNWGEDLTFNAFDGTPYYWDKTLGLTARAVSLADSSGAVSAPTVVRRMMLSGSDRHLVCFGANPIGDTNQDLLMVRWSDQENPFDWFPTATNTAGSQRISSGSEILTAHRTRQEVLIWTDASLHAMRFTGPPYTFTFSLLADNISIIGPNAAVASGDRAFWMGRNNFYAYSGRTQVIPCTVLEHVFSDINLAQDFKFFAASNKLFDEIFWFYASASSDEIDRYVKFNHVEGAWDIGTLVRTAWVDSGAHDNPRAGGASGGTQYIYNHESGQNDDGSAMSCFIESTDFDLGDGEQFMFVDKLIPDLRINDTSSDGSGSVNYLVKTRDFPLDSLQTQSTSNVTNSTQQSFIRARGRQAVVRVESSSLDINWTLGDLRMNIRPDGRR